MSAQEAEWISYVVSAPGPYKIEVRSVDKGASAGRYEIKIEERRKSVPYRASSPKGKLGWNELPAASLRRITVLL